MKWLTKLWNSIVDPRYMYGVNLHYWQHIGHTEIQFTDSNDVVVERSYVHYFVNPDDVSVRKFVQVCPKYSYRDWKSHGYIHTTANPWVAGSEKLWVAVNHSPSQWMKDYMRTVYNHEWREYPHHGLTHWWVEIKHTPTIIDTKDNVVTLDFNGKK